MSISYLRGVTEWALMVTLIFGAGAIARAQDEEPSDKNVVKIGRADGEQPKPNSPRPGDQGQREAPMYWIGLLGGPIPPDHVLRAHIDLPENQGLIVASVVPSSPAAKAGLKQHDILLKANNNDLHEMKDLIDLVMTEGAKKGQITLEILRHNKRETVYLKPEERPANAPVPQVGGGGFGSFGGGDGEFGNPKDLLEQFGGRIPMEFRNFGPGVIVGGGGEGFAVPNGTSISLQKEGDKPAHVTVKRDGKTWEVVGDDPASLKKLPEDLRPTVERMLHGGGAVFHAPQPFRLQGPNDGPDMDTGRMRERLERMEKRLEEMQKRLNAPSNSPAEKPKAENDQAK